MVENMAVSVGKGKGSGRHRSRKVSMKKTGLLKEC